MANFFVASSSGNNNILRETDTNPTQKHLDRTGIWISIACLIHCLALPLLTLTIPALEGLTQNEEFFHACALLLIAPTAAWSFSKGYTVHRNKLIPAIGGLGVVFLTLAFFFEQTVFHSALTSLGGIFLVAAHWCNFKSGHSQSAQCGRH